MPVKIFSIFLCSGYRKTHFRVNKLDLDIFIHAIPQAKVSPMFLSSPRGRGKLLTPQAEFFQESVSPQLKQGEKIMTTNYRQC